MASMANLGARIDVARPQRYRARPSGRSFASASAAPPRPQRNRGFPRAGLPHAMLCPIEKMDAVPPPPCGARASSYTGAKRPSSSKTRHAAAEHKPRAHARLHLRGPRRGPQPWLMAERRPSVASRTSSALAGHLRLLLEGRTSPRAASPKARRGASRIDGKRLPPPTTMVRPSSANAAPPPSSWASATPRKKVDGPWWRPPALSPGMPGRAPGLAAQWPQ